MELSNFDNLDESVSQNYSNAVDPVTAIAQGTGKVAEAMGKAKDANARRAETESRVGCVKPSIFSKKKKKQAYQDCLNSYNENKRSDKSLDRELQLQKLRMSNENNSRVKQPSINNKTILIVGGITLLVLATIIGVVVSKSK